MRFSVIRMVVLGMALAASQVPAAETFRLNERCPPGFETTAANLCQLRTLYDFYSSPPQHGGVRANLPPQAALYSPQQMDLGRLLFFDPLLSVDRTLSCGSCHQPDKGFSDGRKMSVGARQADGRRTRLARGAPTLWNVSFLPRLMWDGRAKNLEDQAALPLFSDVEMANSPEQLTRDLRASPVYRRLFREAFDAEPDAGNTARALAAFQSRLVSFNSRYDRYAHGDRTAMSAEEISGYNVFRGFVARCSQCHVPPLFTDGELAVIGAPPSSPSAVDRGAGALSDDPFLDGAFRVPSLRNLVLTAPYFHAGQFQNLTEVVSFYNNARGHAAPAGLDLKLHWHIHMTDGPRLSPRDEQDIVAFLGTLVDESFAPEIPERVPSGLPVSFELKE